VGYSYGDKINYVHNESEVAEDMYHFLQGFAKKFKSPSITGANDFYIIGESYAGHYVPALGYRILQGNQRGDGPHINLKGIAVGNGLTDPYTQCPFYAEMAYSGCAEKTGKPCITEAAYEEMLSLLPTCMEHIQQCNNESLGYDASNAECLLANAACEEYQNYYYSTGLNSYDVRKPCDGPLCYSMNNTLAFFNNSVVRSALGVSDSAKWSTCSEEVGELFMYDEVKNFNYTFPPMLEAGIRVMIYAGDCDFICNWMGNKAWVTALNWPGKAAFNAAPDVEFSVAGRAAGEERTYGNFSFVRIYDAGHMVPMDQPEVSLYMVSQFLHNQRLSSA
jgi:cathepsin A (carboxypeptidase C)